MKLRLYLYSLVCTALIMNACTKEQPDLFPKSAAERMNNALLANQNVLTQAENGWAMQYFPTENKQGYTFLMKFKTNSFVNIAGKNEYIPKNEIKQDSSLYELIADNGPVLTFNSFNEVFHTFSNPENPNGYGMEGDYEFMIVKSTENEIELKGKKRGVKIVMTKIPVNLTWTQYFDKLDAMNAAILGNHPAPLSLLTPISKYIFSNGTTRIFNILKQGSEINTATNASFIITQTGIRFSKMQELDGKKFQTLNLSDDNSSLISIEDNTIKLTGPDSLAYYFRNDKNEWIVNSDLLSTKLKVNYDIVVQSAFEKYNANNVSLSIKYYAPRNSFVLVLTLIAGKNKYIGYNDISLDVDGLNAISTAEKGTGDKNGRTFYTNISGLSQLIKSLCSSFNISTNTAINPRNIKFINTQDSDSWFTVSRQ